MDYNNMALIITLLIGASAGHVAGYLHCTLQPDVRRYRPAFIVGLASVGLGWLMYIQRFTVESISITLLAIIAGLNLFVAGLILVLRYWYRVRASNAKATRPSHPEKARPRVQPKPTSSHSYKANPVSHKKYLQPRR